MRDVYVITGQTATGKTSLALHTARLIQGECISADSRQIYRHLTIITGKDIPAESTFTVVEEGFVLDKTRKADIGYYTIEGIKLWGLDLVDPTETFSSFDFTLVAQKILSQYIPATTTPVIVGGSYFYIKHLIYGFDVHAQPQWELRKNLEHASVEKLQQLLISKQPELFEKLNSSDRKNPHRLIRKIEIAESTGNNIHPHAHITVKNFTGLRFADKFALQKNIETRVTKRVAAGAFEEVESLLQKGYSLKDPGLQTIGYSQIIEHLTGKCTRETTIQNWITAEVQYAKRQLTFMKNDRHISWKEV